MVTLTDKELAAFDAMYNLLTGSIERCAEQITLLQQRVDSIEGAQPVSKDWLNGIYRQIDNLNIRLNQNQQKVGAGKTAEDPIVQAYLSLPPIEGGV